MTPGFTEIPQLPKSDVASPFTYGPAAVALVGAGPGDPGLLTLRGAALLARADVVVYDALVNPKLLDHCPRAKMIYAGKRAAAHSMTQAQINQLLVEHGLAGRRVVRLKGGDPFVFGRGGEECESLAAAGVLFEVVPGITAAIAAPAYAGIPVTHRDFNSSFTFLTGHEKEESCKDDESKTRAPGTGSDIDWAAVAKLPCLAFYMGVKSLPRICARLIEHGMDPTMPAATVQHGTLPAQRTIAATLATLADELTQAKIQPPALTIIGKVVSMRPVMNWFESRPLFGQTVAVTRTRDQASELSEQLAALGANVLEAPTIELHPPDDSSTIDQHLRTMAGRFDWVLFSSVNGVHFTKRRLMELNLDARAIGPAKIAAIGPATADAVRDALGLRVDLCPERSVAEALADDLRDACEVEGKRFLLLRADIARPVLRERLDADGAAAVVDLAIYETRPAAALPESVLAALADGRVDWVTFTSSSTVHNFAALAPEGTLSRVKRASIGPITSTALRSLGTEPTVEAVEFTTPGLVAALLRVGK